MTSKRDQLTSQFKSVLSTTLMLVMSAQASVFAQQSKPYALSEPITVDFDMETIPEPKEVETGYLYDWADGTVFQQIKQSFDLPRYLRRLNGNRQEALNVNTMDQVPDSSWFTNRQGQTQMSIEEVKRGPGTTAPAAGELTVVRAKNVGAAPGFWVKDRVGQVFILKFDPPDYPELMTAAEVIATKLFHAIGYNVPQNTIVRFRRDEVRVGDGAKLTDEQGRKRLMTQDDLDSILGRVARQTDGTYRAIASLLLPGKPKGGFTFHGQRPDDPNDIIPHERRRDLRALRVFCAWLNHDDIRVGNTLDMYVTEDERRFLRHFLIDFGSMFGSHTVRPNPAEVGHEHVLDVSTATKVLFTGGMYQPSWRSERHDPIRSPAVGRYSAHGFDPSKWKGNFPLVAFEEMTDRDAFWATQIVASFSPEQIRRAVETGEFSNTADAEYLTREIIRRQRIIVEKYAHKLSGLAQFRVERANNTQVLSFTNYRSVSRGEAMFENFKGYSYRMQTVGRAPLLLREGTIAEARLPLEPELINKIRRACAGETECGIVKVLFSQAGERRAAEVHLYAEESGTVRIAGVRL